MTFYVDLTLHFTSVLRRNSTSIHVVKNDAIVFNLHFSMKIVQIFLQNFLNFENRQLTTIDANRRKLRQLTTKKDV